MHVRLSFLKSAGLGAQERNASRAPAAHAAL